MKTKNYLLLGLAFALLFSLDSCKPKESAYKTAYEAAKVREIENQVDEVTPISKPSVSTNDVVQKEKVTVLDGAGIFQFSVVIGSFINKTNADALKDRMVKQGYTAFLAQNERKMYRVIVATFNERATAAAERDRVKNKYYPEFQDAWLLDNQ